MDITCRGRGATIRAVRIALGLGGALVAHRAPCSYGFLSKVENGHRVPFPAMTVKIAAALYRDGGPPIDPAALTGQIPVVGSLRQALGISAAELAAAAGVPVARLADIEDGTLNPSPAVRERLARRLGIPAAVLAYPPVDVDTAAEVAS